jgi:acyl dehydratase
MAEIETVGLGIHWEDLPVGRRFKTIGRTITEADLVAFVNCTGMVEVLFTNTEFLRTESAIKQRVVPGALVYTFAEGLLTLFPYSKFKAPIVITLSAYSVFLSSESVG